MRAKIILACADGSQTGGQVAESVGCAGGTVSKWRNRFAEAGIDGLLDEPRPGAPRTIANDG